MTDTIERFSNRVENYIKYRPDYPLEVLEFLREKGCLTPNSIVADVGCGPGTSSRMFLDDGNAVVGVEPNEAMRTAAETQMAQYPNFTVIEGTSYDTRLQDNSIDLIVAAQAFHWFDADRTRPEFLRILKAGGCIALIWNERQLDRDPFHIEYEEFLLRFGNDYSAVRHENITEAEISAFFQKEYQRGCFENIQEFDLEGLKGRMLSSSYMPDASSPVYEDMTNSLRALFAKHAENDKIKVFYDTNVYLARF
jgi:SAM-dependent methyltransferase